MKFLEKKLKKIIIFLKKFFNFGFDADKDWKTVLFTFLIFVIFFLSVSIFDFFHFTNFDYGDENIKTDFEFVDKNTLQNILDRYDKKALDMERIKVGQEI